ncbi:hypothetical protein DFH09DRAFT_1302542 [Mycena vulgaris]|nr:hypothetical protein DFH09DRAFT_1302542 [Mycena vulgaris]
MFPLPPSPQGPTSSSCEHVIPSLGNDERGFRAEVRPRFSCERSVILSSGSDERGLCGAGATGTFWQLWVSIALSSCIVADLLFDVQQASTAFIQSSSLPLLILSNRQQQVPSEAQGLFGYQ